MSKLKIYTDGGARGNPGPAATGIVVFAGANEIARFGSYLGVATNNIAEYSAVLEALIWLVNRDEKTEEAEFFLDSELVVKQLTGVYKVKSPELVKIFIKIKTALKDFGMPVSFSHVPRAKNREADAVVNQTLDTHAKRA